jgi:hypothetical protein
MEGVLVLCTERQFVGGVSVLFYSKEGVVIKNIELFLSSVVHPIILAIQEVKTVGKLLEASRGKNLARSYLKDKADMVAALEMAEIGGSHICDVV